MIMNILFFSYICFFPLSLQILLPDLTVYMNSTAVTLSEAVSAYSPRAPAFLPIGFLVGSVLLTFLFLMQSYYVSLRSEFHVMMSVTISAYKWCLYEGSCLIYICCVCIHIMLSNTYCVVFLFCLSSLCVSCTQCCQFLLFVHFWKKDIYVFSQRD